MTLILPRSGYAGKRAGTKARAHGRQTLLKFTAGGLAAVVSWEPLEEQAYLTVDLPGDEARVWLYAGRWAGSECHCPDWTARGDYGHQCEHIRAARQVFRDLQAGQQ